VVRGGKNDEGCKQKGIEQVLGLLVLGQRRKRLGLAARGRVRLRDDGLLVLCSPPKGIQGRGRGRDGQRERAKESKREQERARE